MIFIISSPFFVLAQIPPGYYNSAQGLVGNNLKVALYNIIKNNTVVSYGGLWTAFPKSDAKANGKVFDIYSYKPIGGQPYEYTFVTHQCGNYSMESDCYNREHSWPQSWFNSTSGPDSDMFHIYPTDGYVNNQRGNYPFGNTSTVSWTSLNGSRVGACANVGYSSTVFEPINEFKGDLARSYFYMTTRYYSEDAAWGSSPATNKATILPWQLNVLLQWHHQDPVSAKEIARNDSIYYLFQNNRNPFIDHPNWADSIWATLSGIEELHNKPVYSIYPNPTLSGEMTISGLENSNHVSVFNLLGVLVFEINSEKDSEHIDLSNQPSGVYFVRIKGVNSISTLKVLRD